MDNMTYLFRRPCGCAVVIICDSPERKREIANETAKLMRQGLTVERVDRTTAVNEFGFKCEPCKAERAKRCARERKQKRFA